MELDDVEAVAIAYAFYKRHQKAKKRKSYNRRYWVHPMNLKRPQEGQFQINFMSLRAHPEEFTKYYRMSITTFDELVREKNKHSIKKVIHIQFTIYIIYYYISTYLALC